ncbi:MAG: hypothetical protein AAF366_03055 [Pseudomonadota bacterium]
MFARVTPFKMKKESRDAMIQLMHELKSDIMALPGIQHFINVIDDEGRGYVISMVESREVSDANADKVRALWAKFADHLESQPLPEGYEVVADWDKVTA